MTDVVVKIELRDSDTEAKLFKAVDEFASNRAGNSACQQSEDAPQIMVKTLPGVEFLRKSLIFQDRRDAEEFMYYGRRFQQVA